MAPFAKWQPNTQVWRLDGDSFQGRGWFSCLLHQQQLVSASVPLTISLGGGCEASRVSGDHSQGASLVTIGPELVSSSPECSWAGEANRLAALGWCVLPVQAGTKGPALVGWQQFQKTRPTTD